MCKFKFQSSGESMCQQIMGLSDLSCSSSGYFPQAFTSMMGHKSRHQLRKKHLTLNVVCKGHGHLAMVH